MGQETPNGAVHLQLGVGSDPDHGAGCLLCNYLVPALSKVSLRLAAGAGGGRDCEHPKHSKSAWLCGGVCEVYEVYEKDAQMSFK